ncbi:aconitase family protein [Luedemannella helvata]|uniref:3-isopropylmalate dehydratase n=1 Tax=Luedemannella helvata TaxID=349315 RepID=A0ABN2KXK9_9ACTN
MSSTTYTDAVVDRATRHRDGPRLLLSVDLHVLHEVSSPQAFTMLADRALPVRDPSRSVGIPDHVVSTVPRRTGSDDPRAQRMLDVFSTNLARTGIEEIPLDSADHGIVHVSVSESGRVLPGQVVVCGDSHTTTLGALGALAWGIGTSEVAHVLATQAVWTPVQPVVGLRVTGTPGPGAGAKDVVLRVCGELSPRWGVGRRIEWSGPYIDGTSMAERFTLCNMAAELGARSALIPPDETTWEYLAQRLTPERLAGARAATEELTRAVTAAPVAATVDVDGLAPQVSWGTNLSHVADVDGRVPTSVPDDQRRAFEAALAYAGLAPGQELSSVEVQHAFVGSCTNGRIEDLRAAAAVVAGHRVAPSVRAVVVPGSRRVAQQAQEEGIRDVLVGAGFLWREPGCSSCVAINGDTIPRGERCVSSSNRNFEGRQGAGAITHLASPATVAASAITGRLAHPGEVTR